MDMDAALATNIARKAKFKEAELDADAEYDYDAGLDLAEGRWGAGAGAGAGAGGGGGGWGWGGVRELCCCLQGLGSLPGAPQLEACARRGWSSSCCWSGVAGRPAEGCGIAAGGFG